MLAFSDNTSFKRSKKPSFGMLNAGSTINDTVYHFGCSIHTIHNLIYWYNSTASVRVRARPGRAGVTTLGHYHVNTPT